MATNEQLYITTVKLNTEEAKDRLEELINKEKALKEEHNKALKEGNNEGLKKIETELKRVRSETRQFRLEIMEVDEVLDNISSASIESLQKATKAVRSQMRVLATDTKEFAEKQQQLRTLRSRMQEIRREGEAQESWVTRMNVAMNNWQTTIMSAVAAVTGLTMTIRNATKAHAEMEESMADVRKYTGQTEEEVREMNEEFKRIDTRTSREKLNALAGDAGRLGITAKEGIMEFVDAGNMIDVALGDDLGDNAVRNIGKLAQAFGESDKMGLRGAMLATGSAVNELAQSSSASAGYIVEFEARFAGLGNQANMAQTQIMGIASVLDQNMQQVETSSTAVAQLMTKMYSEPEKFAKLAGQSIEDFANLLRYDANEALLAFLESMRAKGGFDSLAPMFDEMGLSGVRCVGVLSTLANNLDEVRKQQEIAAQAFEEGTSVMKEYDVQNNTVQAGLDKARKRFNDIAVDLGEQLLPVVRYTVTAAGSTVKILSVLINFVKEYITEIVSIASAVAAYNIVLNASNIYLRAQYTHLLLVEKAQKLVNAAMRMNPYALVAAAVATLVVWATKLVNTTEKLTEAQKRQEVQAKKTAEANKRILQTTDDLTAKYIRLQREWSVMASKAEKNKWIKNNQTAFSALGVSVKTVNDANDIFIKKSKEVVAALKAVAEASAYSSMYEESIKKQAKFDRATEGKVRYRNARKDLYGNLSKAEKTALRESGIDRGGGSMLTEEEIKFVNDLRVKAKRQEYIENKKMMSEEAEFYAHKMLEAQKKVQSNAKFLGAPIGGTITSTEGKGDTEENALQKSKELAQKENAINDAQYAAGMLLKAEYEQRKYEITLDELDRELAIYKKGSQEYENVLAERQKVTAQSAAYNTRLSEQQLDEECEKLADALKAAYYDASSEIYGNQEALEQALFENSYSFLEKRRNLYAVSSQEYHDLSKQMEEEDGKNRLRLAKEYEQKIATFKNSYLQISEEERLQTEMRFADDLHKKGLLSEEEYNRARDQIREKYIAKEKDDENQLGKYRSGIDEMTDSVLLLGDAFAELSQKMKDGTADWKDYAAVGEAAIISVMSMMSAMSKLYSASCQLEVVQTEKKFDDMISAAGKNEKRQEQLEKKKQEEVAKIKTRYNERAMKMEIAQALAQTAMAAINAYSSAAQVPLIGYILAPIAAATALAAGAVNIAAIKKQHQAEAIGYYEGGYTGGTDYRKEAGVVHEGEFVANHVAVNNPVVAPVLDIIDYAQRHNTVGSITSRDIAKAVGAGNAVVTPVVNVTMDNEGLAETLEHNNEVMGKLYSLMSDEGIKAVMDFDEFDRKYKKYINLKKNV